MSETKEHNDNYWYYLGRSSMCDQLALKFGKEAGEHFTRGHDTIANLFRTMMEEMRESAKKERKTADEFEKKMRENESNDPK